MRMLLGISVEKDDQVEAAKETVERAKSYFDEVVILLEGKGEFGRIIKWCEQAGHDYVQYREGEKGAERKMQKKLGLTGAEFMLWLDAGDTETEIEKIIIENIQKSYFKPRTWGKREICYYGNFGSQAIERWSPKKMQTGLGGSETAVIELSREWARLGYQVTVYGDPGIERGEYEGVRYLPWYEFNIHDFFNIFIQWRGVYRSELAIYIKSRQYYMDMHDIFHEQALLPNVHAIDKVMVKSNFQRRLASKIPESKFSVIGNGI